MIINTVSSYILMSGNFNSHVCVINDISGHEDQDILHIMEDTEMDFSALFELHGLRKKENNK